MGAAANDKALAKARAQERAADNVSIENDWARAEPAWRAAVSQFEIALGAANPAICGKRDRPIDCYIARRKFREAMGESSAVERYEEAKAALKRAAATGLRMRAATPAGPRRVR
ncbi:MAG: hypothetical protein BWZ10_03445 [candidate division BRC1 bacterium ADurb.BinA364]|nr:MAG: hypothetical protein BWZ10_03445 [candidate division BRC1 bacterium ADurb.BinA364]